MEDNGQIKVLFERYLADECTPEQIRKLVAYFGLPEDNGTLRNLITQHFESPESNDASANGAVQEVYNRLLNQLDVKTEVKPAPKYSYSLPLWSRMAAVWVLLAVSCGITAYFFMRKADHAISENPTFSSVQMQTTVTGIGEKKKILLEDGSVVWLNAKSKLTYPASFEKNSREVSLEGEAYFEIFRDVNRPFTVESGQVRTKVLGTSFNIQAYDADPAVSVTVLTGKVQVNASESVIQIVRNQQVKYMNGNIYKEVDIDATAQIAWQNGKLQFRNKLLSDVIKTLERNYTVAITYNAGLSDCYVHADFDAETPIENVMEMLAVSLGGNVNNLGNAQYRLEGNCKDIRARANDAEE
ncbi:FecR domain-containing protein [Dyadobacter sp. CY327]|uniref:FecR family protein n=1 Tax=Dyadobacter sp. CY327 TaxID=2907301 RepID=UPI001F453495|nr:FecR family protein [Dyadobacter sp. CY327]MCE7070121.1 FecR domain-containing protein [Dyadobacter sp. CY327]